MREGMPILEPLEARLLLGAGAIGAGADCRITAAGGCPAVGASQQDEAFPFTKDADRFYLDGEPVFLNMISYQPLEPGQAVDGQIREHRIEDDLRRWRQYAGGTDPVLLRVYAQPTMACPVRMPQSFYDGVRELGFWVVRDIYFADGDITDHAAGRARVDAVIAEVETVGGFDRIFAWEIGNEFQVGPGASSTQIADFISAMADHVKGRMAEPGREGYSDWVTWACWPPADVLRTDGEPVVVESLDYFSYNAYSYEPFRMRDHQGGPGTGTPYAGYLAALKDYHRHAHQWYPWMPNLDRPIVIAETGLPDSPTAPPAHDPFPPWAPSYRKGAIDGEVVAEGLADRYWDARLSDSVAGFGLFEWNDEWWKTGSPSTRENPEEHFGVVRFGEVSQGQLVARNKLQQETLRGLFAQRWQDGLISLDADDTELAPGEVTELRAAVSAEPRGPAHHRWETSRGGIVGDSETGEFRAADVALGDATITAVVTDVTGLTSSAELTIQIDRAPMPTLELLTLGTTMASGRVDNVDLDEYRLACYIRTNEFYVQPYTDMDLVWVRPDGYWWSVVHNEFDGDLVVYVVPRQRRPIQASDPVAELPGSDPAGWDEDNDLLPKWWEQTYWPGEAGQGRWDDSDADGKNNLEEMLDGSNPKVADNDTDGDGLPDNWERAFLGAVGYGRADDPDGDGSDNGREMDEATHPGRSGVDRDADLLPDHWETRMSGGLDADPGVDAFLTDYYEIGPLVGDTDLDGAVGAWDYLALKRGYGSSPAVWAEGDVDFSGGVGFEDYVLMRDNFGLAVAGVASASADDPPSAAGQAGSVEEAPVVSGTADTAVLLQQVEAADQQSGDRRLLASARTAPLVPAAAMPVTVPAAAERSAAAGRGRLPRIGGTAAVPTQRAARAEEIHRPEESAADAQDALGGLRPILLVALRRLDVGMPRAAVS